MERNAERKENSMCFVNGERREVTPQSVLPQEPSGIARDNAIPGDILLHIARFLHPSDISDKFVMICKNWYTAVTTQEFWEESLQIHPIVDLVVPVEGKAPLAERRSKGRLQVGRLRGTGSSVAIRSVSLETTNAGKDDGVPTSCLRELALWSDISHPGVARNLGGLVRNSSLTIVSNYGGCSLLLFLASLANTNTRLTAAEVKSFIWQMFVAVGSLHKRGVIHRNLKADNFLICKETPLECSRIQLCDLTASRLIDFPFGCYTPEDPKERDRSYREQRRLYSRAPELLMRQPVYGVEIDIWSLGCLFIEMALNAPPFRAETEIGLLLTTMQLCGTPDVTLWDRFGPSAGTVLPNFPVWPPLDLRKVARCIANPDLRSLGLQAPPLAAYSQRGEILATIYAFGELCGVAALHLLERLLALPGCLRVSAKEALKFPYFVSDDADNDPVVKAWVSSVDSDAFGDDQENFAESSLGHLRRVILDEKKRMKRVTSFEDSGSTAFWDAIAAMEERATRVPVRYSLSASLEFDYVGALEQHQRFVNRLGAADVATTPLADNVGLPGESTPVPRRSRALERRRRESATPTEVGGPDNVDAMQDGSDVEDPPVDVHGGSHETRSSLPRHWHRDAAVRRGVGRGPRSAAGAVTAMGFDEEGIVSTDDLPSPALSSAMKQQIALSQSPVSSAKLRPYQQRTGQLNAPSKDLIDTLAYNRRVHVGGRAVAYRFPGSVVARSSAAHWLNLQAKSALARSLYAEKNSFEVLPPACLPRVKPRTRMEIVNYLLGIQPEFLLKAQTVHIAVGIFDRYVSYLTGYPEEFTSWDFVPVALACLKIADLYNETSKEYYKQDNLAEYCEFARNPSPALEPLTDERGRKLCEAPLTPQDLAAEESKVLNKLRFEVAIPTVIWFLDCYLSVARLLHLTYLVDYCHYLADLSLLSHHLLAHRPSLQAQVILVLGVAALLKAPKRDRDQNNGRGLAEVVSAATKLLRHFTNHKERLCGFNVVWDVLDCVAIYRELISNGRRYFEAVGLRSVDRLHPRVLRKPLQAPTLAPQLVAIILPSHEVALLTAVFSL